MNKLIDKTVNKKNKRKDTLEENDFTLLNNPPRKRHAPLPDEILSDDENEDMLEEILIGMEYDLDPGEDDWSEEDDTELGEEASSPNEPSHHPNP
jgi:hypothetical protein